MRPSSVNDAEKIDAYARKADYWPHIPYEDVGQLIVEEAALFRVGLPLACGLVEWESGFKQIFGCDAGAPFCHKPVTLRRVKLLLAGIEAGNPSQGTGLTQLTAPELIRSAEELGGAHVPRYQLRVGFKTLRGHMDALGTRLGIGAYNGGRGNPILSYAEKVLEKRDEWRERLWVT